MRRFLAVSGLMLSMAGAVAARQQEVIRGRVVDADSKKGLVGATVVVVGLERGTATVADGEFLISVPTAGEHTLEASFIGYTSRSIVASDAARPVVIELTPTVLPGQTIVITASRGRERETPATFSTLTAKEIASRYSVQDIPQLLEGLPSMTWYSENGNGIGYNYLNIRGFDQRRISVMVNGVPQNDPEDHNVYWLDFPDLASSLSDVQVQRGSGSAFFGPPAIGGSVNMVSSTASGSPGISLYAGHGTYNTRKVSVEVGSGLIDGRYVITGRLGRIQSDGYRERSWTDFSSYYLSAVRFDETMTTQFNFYGGPIADHLAYYGIAKADAYSSDESRRRQNPILGPDEVENFSQPHYELLHEWRLNRAMTLNNTLFLVTGSGFFDYDGSWAPYSYYRLTPAFGFPVAGDPDTLYIPHALIRAFVDNVQYGWLPRFRWEHERGDLTVAGEVRVHRSIHWGGLRWGDNLPGGATSDRHYYEYRGGKDMLSLSAQEIYHPEKDLTFLVSAQYVFNRYLLYDEKYLNTDFRVPYHFLNPKIGVNYNVSDMWDVYGQIAVTSREPRLTNLYNAAEASTPASWGPVTPQFATTSTGTYDFSSPLVKPERLTDVEFGTAYTGSDVRAGVTAYWMEFRDEIVKNGQLDRFGQPVTGNAERTRHTGIELTGAVRPLPWLSIEGNLTLSRNRLVKYSEYEGSVRSALDGNAIAGFPDRLANLRVTCELEHATLGVALQHVGDFFTDNFQNPDNGRTDRNRTVDARTVCSAWISVHGVPFSAGPTLEMQLQASNILDVIYATNGEGDEFFPASRRNVFASVKVSL